MPAILEITDGTTTISLLRGINGFCLQDWQQNVLQYKNDGVWQDSSLSDGRQLALSKYANIVDIFTVAGVDSSQDLLIADVQELARLLEKGVNYWKSDWQQEPVWIKAQASQETNPRYTIVKSWAIPELNNAYSQPFLQPGCAALFNETNVRIEHGPWTAWPPIADPCDSQATETQTGCFPAYLEFDGDSGDVNCGSGASIDDLPSGGDITVQAWVLARSYGEANNGRIIVKGSADLTLRGWHLQINSAFGLRGYIDCATQDAISSSGLDEFTADSAWHHVLMTYSEAGNGSAVARTIYLAIDGTWVASYPTQQISIGAYSSEATDDLIIGNSSSDAHTFDGYVGWSKVDSTVLYDPGTNFTPEQRCTLPDIDATTEIQVIYEGTGSTTYDRSGNDNDGTITSAEWGCDCTTTDTNNVDCNCVEASGEQENWEYEEWALQDAQPAGSVNCLFETTAGTLLAGESSSNIWRSVDGTAPWVAVATPPAPNVNVSYIVEMDDGNLYLVGSDTGTGNTECWRSVDDGQNWVLRNNNLGQNIGGGNRLATDGTNLYAAVLNAIVSSADGGTTWNTIYSSVPGQGPTCVFYDRSTDILYAAGTIIIVRSTDIGTTWELVFTDVNAAWQNIKVFSGIVYAPYTSGGDLYILVSTDNGQNWSVTANIGTGTAQEIIERTDGHLYIVDSGAGKIFQGASSNDWKEILDIVGTFHSIVEYSGNDRLYAGEFGDIYIGPRNIDIGRDDTCLDEVFISNKANIAQLTNIFVYDASTTTYISQFPASVFPFFLLPSPFAVGDIVYFGIDPAVFNSGSFCSLVFDLLQGTFASGGTALIWEYSQGGAAFAALNVYDETIDTYELERIGNNGVYWVPPDDWATDAINGVTALWVRLRVTNLLTWYRSPLQQYRDVYTVTWPRIDIDDLDILGDIPARLRIKAHNRSDEDAYESDVDELDLLDNRMIIGLRSLDRGSAFVAYINTADESIVANTYAQNPIGITITDGTGTTTATEIHAPSGIAAVHTTQGNGIDSYDDALTISFGPSIARDFYGEFHVYLRAQLYEPAASPVGDHDDVRVRLRLQTGSGGIIEDTSFTKFIGWDADDGAGTEETYKDYQLLDFDKIRLPISSLFRDDELPDDFTITIQVSSVASTNLRVEFYDLVLMPSDEWTADLTDTALEDDSGVSNGYLLDVDSVSFPKRKIRASVRTADAAEFIKSAYQSISATEAILQANADQRLWFLAARGVAEGEHTGANNAATLTDSYADFIDAGIKVGSTIYNVTDGSSAEITAVTQTTIVGTLVGGAEDDWDTGDVYFVVCPNWRSEPWVVHSVQLTANERYVSMRGAR